MTGKRKVWIFAGGTLALVVCLAGGWLESQHFRDCMQWLVAATFAANGVEHWAQREVKG